MSIWQISESGTDVALDEQGRGEVTFTVKNTSAAQERSVLTISALDGAAESWFTVEEPQRLVPPQDSAAYLCKVLVPAGTAAGTYAMQAVAYSADRDPGETSTTGRRVTVTVKATPPPPPPPKPWWAFVLAAVVILAVIGVVLRLVLGGDDGLANEEPPTIEGTPEVPEVLTASEGTWSEASEDLTFAFQWQRCDGDGADCEPIDGAVLPTYQAGADDEGATLQVEVTATLGEDDESTAVSEPTDVVAPATIPPVVVPNVVGLRLSDARNQLTSLQVTVLNAGAAVDDCNPFVEDQEPPATTEVQAGERIFVTTRPIDDFIRRCVIIFDQPFLIDDTFQFRIEDLEDP